MPYSKTKHTKEEIKKLRADVLRRYAKKHQDKIRVYQRKFYRKNADKFKKWRASPQAKKYISEYKTKWKLNNPKYAANWALLNTYGISLAQRDELFKQNGGLCQICSQRPSTHLDHCHNTGKIRGGLCHKCNVGIGMLNDDMKLVMNAYEYLKRNE